MAANQKFTHVIAGRTIAKVQQDGAALILEFSDGSAVHIQMEAETSSVMVRDKSGTVEYAD